MPARASSALTRGPRRRHNPGLDAAWDSAIATRQADFLRLIGQGMPVQTAARATAGWFLIRRWRAEDAAFAAAYEALIGPRRPRWTSPRRRQLRRPPDWHIGLPTHAEAANRGLTTLWPEILNFG